MCVCPSLCVVCVWCVCVCVCPFSVLFQLHSAAKKVLVTQESESVEPMVIDVVIRNRKGDTPLMR